MDEAQLSTATALFQSGYKALKASESLLFTLSPIPLQPIKGGVQEIGIPLALTALATQDPMFGDAISHAIGSGGDLMSTMVTQAVSEGLSHWGQSINAHLMEGFGVQTAANGIGQAVNATTLGATAVAAKAGGMLTTGLLIGRGAIKAAQAMTQVPIRSVIEQGQRSIASAKQWLQKTANEIRQNRFGVNTVSELNGQNPAYESAAEQTPDPNLTEGPTTESGLNNGFSPEPDEGQTQTFVPETEVDVQVNKPIEAQEDKSQTVTALGEEIDPTRVARELETTLSMRGLDTQHFKIVVDGKEAYKMGGGDVLKNTLEPDAAKMIKQALEDPASLAGSVKIVQGGKTLLHVRDGQIITDPLGIAKEAAEAQINSPTAGQMLYTKASANVHADPNNFQGAQQIAANALALGATREQVKTMLVKHSPAIDTPGRDEATKNEAAEKVLTSAERLANGYKREPVAANAPAMRR